MTRRIFTVLKPTPSVSNRLGLEASPYLRQHKDNPVHWQPWDDAALESARRANKPILLSIGYSACHWCHVMAHESFENNETAALMNEHFINIKVDREERPDLDVIYQTALGLMGEAGGWPLTMFLTPEGKPYWGGTYFPPTARYGRPAFNDVLRGISDAYHHQGDKVTENVRALEDAMQAMTAPQGGQGLSDDLIKSAANIALRAVDVLHGGTEGAPKFPQAPFFRFLWHSYLISGDIPFGAMVQLTLERMSRGGIYDHLGGGFARYSTDEFWLVPHFEKMLYDNAQLIELLSAVHARQPHALWAARVRETINWAMREMRILDKDRPELYAFATALDADTDGEEGRFYVWREAEVDAALGDDADAFKQAYDITAQGNWEGKCVLQQNHEGTLGHNNAGPGGLGKWSDTPALSDARGKLFGVRATRTPPGLDNKVLTDANGMMIAALARAGMQFDKAPWLEAAETTFAFICKNLIAQGRLHHTYSGEQARFAAVLDDIAQMARAAITLFEITAKPDYLLQAEAWVDNANRRMWDDAHGGYFLVADDTADVIHRPKTIADNAQPSANGTMVEVLAKLFHLTGNDAYRQRCEELIRVFSHDQPQHLINSPALLDGHRWLNHACTVVVVGDDGDADSLHQAAVTSGGAFVVVQRTLFVDNALPTNHPAHAKELVDGKSAAYVCRNQMCGAPILDAKALRENLLAP